MLTDARNLREYTPHAFVMYCVQNYSRVLWDTIYFSTVTKNHMLPSARALFQQDNDPWHTCKELFFSHEQQTTTATTKKKKVAFVCVSPFEMQKRIICKYFMKTSEKFSFRVTQETFSPHYCIFFCFSSWMLLERTCMINYPSLTPTTKKQHI